MEKQGLLDWWTNFSTVGRIARSALLHPPIASSLLGGAVVGGPDFNDDSLDFFKVICEELNKINNFFIGKLAQLRILLEEITRLVSLLLLYTTNRVALKVLSYYCYTYCNDSIVSFICDLFVSFLLIL